MTRTRRTWTLLSTAAIALGCAIWFVAGQFTLADLARHEQALRGLIAAHPFRAWCVGWAVYFLAALVPGTRGKAIGFGWLFGFWPALLLVNFALTAAAISPSAHPAAVISWRTRT